MIACENWHKDDIAAQLLGGGSRTAVGAPVGRKIQLATNRSQKQRMAVLVALANTGLAFANEEIELFQSLRDDPNIGARWLFGDGHCLIILPPGKELYASAFNFGAIVRVVVMTEQMDDQGGI
jgi:hypothetical protein